MSRTSVLEKVENDIKEHGWHVLSVFSENEPSFSYTVGFKETLNHSEVIISGLNTKLMHQLLNDIGELIKEGNSFSAGDISNEVIKGYPVKFVAVNESNIKEYFRVANARYGKGQFQAIQCLWSDKHGTFPEKTDANQEVLG